MEKPKTQMPQTDNERPLAEEENPAAQQENRPKWDVFQSAILDYASANRIPYKGTFELTPRCSLKCKMCLMRLDGCDMPAQGRELTTAEWIRLGGMAFEAGTMDLLLTGGEPMLRPDFAEIYEALSDMGFLLRVFTNGTLLTPKILSLFEERPPQGIELTVYGASPETYERVGG
ncbi:MAG TPA: radical SAM protein, partial [Clostridia bacterium]|nr:radical SAM protein [Clostridia bacterium]